ncbi:MAG: hypothetical protein JKY42_00875 [Flavobacteriales bacterium]|nr:hypothetical protein [Flavobacteriales bacterium]
MKKLILTFAIAFTSFGLAAQKAKAPGYEIYYRAVEPVSTDDIKIEIVGNHCQADFCRFKIKITNNSRDYIILKTEELEFVLEHNTYKPVAKNIVINPYKSVTKTINVNGDNRFQVENYTLNLKGFYKVSVAGEEVKMENFTLPAKKNEFEAGNFKCKINGEIVKVTQVTEVPCICTYTGTDVAIIDQSKTVIKLENGQEYATTNRGSKLQTAKNDNIVFSGEKKKIKAVFKVPAKIVDMQFANLEIDWKDTFRESKLVPLELPSQNFVIDPGMTEGKN